MNAYDLAQRLIQRFGKTLGLEDLSLEGGTHSCALEFDGSLVVTFEFHEPTAQMVLSSVLAPMPQDRAEPLLRALMEANAIDYLTSQGLFSLEPQTQSLILMQSKPVADLDDATFERLVEAFVNKVELWTQRVGQILAGEAVPSLAPGGLTPGDEAHPSASMPQRPYDGAHIFG